MQSQKTDNKEANIIFAEGISFYKIVWCFIFGSTFGTWAEEIITFIKYGVWENRSAVILGPFNPLYGTAYIIAILLFYRVKNPLKVFIYGSIFGGIFEYSASWAQEYFTGSASWDYTYMITHINGRTSVIMALVWGVLVVLSVSLFFPHLSRFIEKIPNRFGVIFTRFMIIFLSLNMFITYSMLIRQGLRHKGIEPFTPIGVIYDEIFTDEYILKLFPNMVLLEGDEDE